MEFYVVQVYLLIYCLTFKSSIITSKVVVLVSSKGGVVGTEMSGEYMIHTCRRYIYYKESPKRGWTRRLVLGQGTTTSFSRPGMTSTGYSEYHERLLPFEGRRRHSLWTSNHRDLTPGTGRQSSGHKIKVRPGLCDGLVQKMRGTRSRSVELSHSQTLRFWDSRKCREWKDPC